MAVDYVTPPQFYKTSNDHQTIPITNAYPATQLVWPEGLTVHLLNLDPTNTIYLGNNNAIIAGDLAHTIPLVPGASYISAGNLPVFGICKTGQTALLARSPDAINYFVPAGTTVSTSATLGEDPSTPAVFRGNGVTGTKTGTSASFSPPASSLLVCIVNAAATALASSISISDSGGHTWTTRVSQNAFSGHNPGSSVIFTTFLSSAPGSITVTVSSSDASSTGLQFSVRVLNNANSNQGSAATAGTNATVSSGTANQQISITTTQGGSWVYCCGLQASGNDSTAIAGTTTIDDFLNTSGTVFDAIIGRQSSPTGTPGPTTLGWTFAAPGDYTIVALEILHA